MDSRMTISQLIRSGKFKVTNKEALINILYEWKTSGLWEWKASSRSSGLSGFPKGLYNGLQIADNLLSGILSIDFPLYDKYPNKKWTMDEMIHSLKQMSLAAYDKQYHPADPARKKYLQKIPFDKFFWQGFIKGEPQAYTHAPFLYFYETGAKLNEDCLEAKIPDDDYLCTFLTKMYREMSNTFDYTILSTREQNRLVDFSNQLNTWYLENQANLTPSERRISLVAESAAALFKTWRKPISLSAFCSQRAFSDIRQILTSHVSSRQLTDTTQRQMPSYVLQGTALLKDFPDPLEAFCVFCVQNGIDIQKEQVDDRGFLCCSDMALRQVARKWKQGDLRRTQQPTLSTDWRNVQLRSIP